MSEEEIEFLRVVTDPDDWNSAENIRYECYNPNSVEKMRRGEAVAPDMCAIEYVFDHPIRQICNALGWQGGTIHQVIAEIKRLKEIELTALAHNPRKGG